MQQKFAAKVVETGSGWVFFIDYLELKKNYPKVAKLV